MEGLIKNKKQSGALIWNTHLTVVSVERLQLLDIIHVDALRQRLAAQVR